VVAKYIRQSDEIDKGVDVKGWRVMDGLSAYDKVLK